MKLAMLAVLGLGGIVPASAQTTPFNPVPPHHGQMPASERFPLPGSVLRVEPVDMVDGVPLTTGSLGREAVGLRNRSGVIAAPTRAAPPFIPD